MSRRVVSCCILVVAVAIGAPALAQTSCSANDQLTFNFATASAASLSYAGTSSYTATSPGGASQSFSVGFATYGLSTPVVAGTTLPAINTMINDGSPITGNNLVIGGVFTARTTSITANTNVIVTTFTFATPVREFVIQTNDVDYASNQYRDWEHVIGISGGNSYTASIVSPFGTDNGAGAKTNASSSYQLGSSATPLTVGVNEAIGNAVSGNNSNTGTLTATFAQPVTSIVLRYGNSSQNPGGTATGQQAFGVQLVRFCPMPNIVIAKTSAPVATTGTTRFNIPGSDVDYTITVKNTGLSTVDINTALIGDILPANVTFFNGDIDTVTPGTQNFVFTPGSSGVTLGSGNISYSNNGGASYAYSPVAGYDPATNALRFNPQGTMAANSSFTIRFRAQVR